MSGWTGSGTTAESASFPAAARREGAKAVAVKAPAVDMLSKRNGGRPKFLFGRPPAGSRSTDPSRCSNLRIYGRRRRSHHPVPVCLHYRRSSSHNRDVKPNNGSRSAGFPNIGDHHSVSEPSYFKLHEIPRAQIFQHSTVRDMERHFHSVHPDAAVGALHIFRKDGD